MTIYDVLIEENAKIYNGDKWMIIEPSENGCVFIVYQHKMYARNTVTLYDGLNENMACEALKQEEK